jgi:hypothetical protein
VASLRCNDVGVCCDIRLKNIESTKAVKEGGRTTAE